MLIGCALMACNRISVDFTYSPDQPRAGQAVTFTNKASDGEKWNWTFGDGSTSTSKSPSHTYKQPGTYTVILQVDEKSSLTRTRDITIYDTIPNFSCSDSIIKVFEDVTFTALVYNPYGYTISYEWTIGSNRLYTQLSETNTAATYKVYFNQAGEGKESVQLRVVVNGDTTIVKHDYEIADVATKAVLMRGDKDYAQRIFGTRSEPAHTTTNTEQVAQIDAAQDTMQVFNDSTFTLSRLATTFPGIKGFRIANRKIYYRTDGLYVANINGANKVQIDPLATAAICVDVVDNRLYWAVADSVRYMPLVGTENNRFTTTPTTLNTLQGVTRIAIDQTER